MRSSNAIHHLIVTCLDDERTLAHESKEMGGTKSAVLARLASERRHFVDDLERLTNERAKPSFAGLVRELRSDLWARAAGHNAGDAVAVCRRSQHRTEADYEKALGFELPADARRVLASQYARVLAARDELAQIAF